MTTKAAFPVFDALHLGLMLVALGLAYILPFELVLLSYAILGPLHYLTEISWLHERSYFMKHRRLAVVLAAGTVAIFLFGLGEARQIQGFILCAVLAFSAAFTLFETSRTRGIILLVGMGIGVAVACVDAIDLPLVTLLPTVIHVSVFTFLFMLVGALRSRSLMQAALITAYVLCIALIFIFPPPARIVSMDLAMQGPKFFGSIGTAFGQIFGQKAWPFDARLAGFLSFIYTYHYLNWFIKVKVIKWSDVPKQRLLLTAILGVGATSLYFINYTLGFLVLLNLSLLHVLLEFPLNVISIKEIVRMTLPSRPAVS